MAKDVEIKIKVVNESGDVIEKTAKSMDDLEQSVASLSKELKNAPLGSAKFKELDSALKENQKTLEKTKTSTMGLGEKLSSIGGPIGGVIQGFIGMGKAAMAFVTNPIGAVIAVLGVVFMAVSSAIKKSKDSMDAVTKITEIFSGIIQPLITFIQDVAVSVLNALASGLETVAGWFGASGKAAGDLATEMDKVNDKEKELSVSRAKTNMDLAATKEILSDTNEKYEDRVAALNKVKTAETEQSAQELANAAKKLNNAKLFLAAHKGEEEAIQAEKDATIALYAVAQDASAKQRTFNKQEKALNSEKAAQEKQAAADAKSRADKAAAEKKARRDTALAGDKAALAQAQKYDEEITLSLIKNEQEREVLTLQYAQKAAKKVLDDQILTVARLVLHLASIKAKHEEESQQYEHLLNARVKLVELQGIKLKELQDKQSADRLVKQKDDNAKTLQETESTYQKEVKFTDEYYKSLNTALLNSNLTEKELKDKQYQLDLSRLQEQLVTNQNYGKSIVDIEAQIADKKRAHAEEAKKLSDEEYAKKVENAKAVAAVIVDSLNSIAALQDQKAANELTAINTKYEAQLKAAEGDKTATARIEAAKLAESNAVKKKAFDNNKKLQYATAIINGAVAVGSIIAQYPKFDGGIAMAIALIAASAALAFQLAKIKSTEFVPDAGGGGGGGGGGGDAPKPAPSMFAGGGYVSGTGTGTSDSISARLSNGESVINANSTAQFGGLLSLINQAGGGRPFAGGGTANGNMGAPVIKTYVVASDMTSQQEADFRIKQVARL